MIKYLLKLKNQLLRKSTPMKNRLLLIILFLSTSLFAQENKEQKIDISFSYGLSYIEYSKSFLDDPVPFELPNIGSFYEINFDYKLPKNRYIGLGYSRLQHAKNIDDGVLLTSTNTGLVLQNYRNIHTKDFYDVHFRTIFKNNLQFTLGAYYFIENMNRSDITNIDNNTVFVLINEKNRADNLGLFGSLEYYFKLNSYAELGLKSKLYYSLNGIESIAALPTLRVKL